MRFQTRLMAFGMPLVVLPLAASLVIFSFNMAASEQATRFQVLEAELSLVENQVQGSWQVLSRVGFGNSDFYQQVVIQTLETNLRAVTVAGDVAVVIDPSRRVLLGPPEYKGRTIEPTDPWYAAVATSSGQHEFISPGVVGGEPYLVVYRHFQPWRWLIATVTPQGRVWANVLEGLTWALLGSMLFVLLAAYGFCVLARGAARPLVQLQSLAVRMGQGQFDDRAQVSGPDEVLSLAREWNAMADQVQQLTTGLEQRVTERTHDLAEALGRTQAIQGQLVFSEKMAALGQLVSGIAHELNTPLGAIDSAQRTIHEALGSRWPAQMEALASLGSDLRSRLWAWLDQAASSVPGTDTLTRRKVRKALTTRFQSAGVLFPEEVADQFVEVGLVEWTPEDLALLAGEAGRPLVAAVGELAQVRLASALVGLAVTKASRVIGALRVYSRQDSGHPASFVPLAASFDTVLTLVQSRLKSGIEVVVHVPPDLEVLADPDRLDQLWTNLITNALSAMGATGRLTIEASRGQKQICVRVIDSGPGIPPDLQARIFTPFFTTKKAGEGSGLGLSICQTIVQETGGTLTFSSVPGQTVFEARFPCP